MGSAVAITGMAGTFPGAASVAELWDRIAEARVAPQVSLESRWGIPRSRYLAAPGVPGKTYIDEAFAIEDERAPGEALDRQVRLGRRAVLAALANSAASGRSADLAETGLVAATSWTAPSYYDAYEARATAPFGVVAPSSGEAQDPAEQLAALAASLGGPAIAVDTACASSLYALDAAIGLLETGQASRVVVLGLNAMLPPFLYAGFAKLMALSPTARIRPFLVGADGVVPGECAAAVVVERLDEALRAERQILGVVRAVGLAADGSERGVFAPGAEGQRLAYARAFAGIDPSDVDYVEAHGTATVLGDETEISSLDSFFGQRRAAGAGLPIGSVKGLVGHTLAAAGMVSLIKVLLMMRERTVPPHLAGELHPRLRGTRLVLPEARAPWETPQGRPLRAGISCFGFGGANAHVVVESLHDTHRRATASVSRAQEPLAIVDIETAFGGVVGAGAWSTTFDSERPLPSRFELDGAGLRTGPNLLRRIDPLQLLLTHLTREILERHPSARGSAETGVATTCNLGGDLSLKLAQNLAVSFRCPADEAPARSAAAGRELTPEAIASSLPTMCSGYAAYHFDLRAFHQTFAGAPGTFWVTWGLAPYWLRDRCGALLLGAATRAVGLEEGADVERAEGACVLLLKELAAAQAAGDTILATVRTVPAANGGDDARAACAAAGIALDPATAITNIDLGVAPLAEAAAVDSLARAALRGGEVLALHVGGRLLSVVVVAKVSEIAKTPRPARVPVTVTLRPEVAAVAPLPPPATLALRVSPPASLFDSYMATNAAALEAFFRAQGEALRLLAPGGHEQRATPRPPARRSENVVIGEVTDRGGRYATPLRVDETHRYFFDHPLDHVPGILLAEGALQLLERAAPALLSGGQFVRRFELRFRHFCEKGEPSFVELGPKPDAPGLFTGKVLQGGDAVTHFEVQLDAAVPRVQPFAPPDNIARPLRDRRLLHKHHEENVLVGELLQQGDAYLSHLCPPPPHHFFADGSSAFHSPLYLIEGVRQALTLGSHTVLGIPFGRSTNLLSVRLTIDGPIPREAPVAVRFKPGKVRKLGEMTLADVKVGVESGSSRLGVVELSAQVVDSATYQQQRGAKS